MSQVSLFTSLIDPPPTDWTPEAPPDLTGVHEIELDCETTGLKWWAGHRPLGIAIRYNGRTQYLPFGHRGGNLPEDTVKRWATRELRGKLITNLNVKFDHHMLREWGVDLEAQGNVLADVGHDAALLDDHRRRFSLEELAQDELGRGKVTGLEITKLAEYHAGQVAAYAEEDVQLVGELKAKYLPRLEAEDLMRVRDLENRTIYAVAAMEARGAPLDVEMLKTKQKECEQDYYKLLWKIHRRTGVKVRTPDTNEDLVKLCKHLGLPYWLHATAAGKPSFTEEILMQWSHDENIQDVILARNLANLDSKYYTKYLATLRSDGMLRYGLHQLRADEGGAVTGRFSSSAVGPRDAKEGANIQQVPRPYGRLLPWQEILRKYIIRQLFKPRRRGWKWVKADAKQIEYRIFAHYTNSPELLKRYKDDPDTDFHQSTMEMIQRFRDIERQGAKNINFTFIYGGGVKKLALVLGVDLETAQEFSDAYHQAIPEVRPLLNRASNAARVRGFVHTLMGRRGRFPTLERIYKALNTIIQGGAADIMKVKLCELHELSKQLDFPLYFTVHDEADLESENDEMTDKIRDCLNHQSFPQLRVPILWDVKSGPSWAEAA